MGDRRMSVNMDTGAMILTRGKLKYLERNVSVPAL
jgi:hypothetical protein